MPKIGNEKPYADRKCDRCGSKRKVTKAWTEKVENTFSDGFMTLYHKQIICTNIECQTELEDLERKEKEKRELRLAKKANRTDIKINKVKTA